MLGIQLCATLTWGCVTVKAPLRAAEGAHAPC
jgi:hypothetical protein